LVNIFQFLRKYWTILQNNCTIFNSHEKCVRISVPSHPHQKVWSAFFSPLWYQGLNSGLRVWATSNTFLALVVLEIGSCFCLGWPGLWSSYCKLPTVSRMTGVCHHAHLFSIEMWPRKLFCQCWFGIMILLISAS
jgi:hypothetical protein